ncbi:hypothetical protein SEA_FAITH5X5_58 [Gordonia phage Faith5x5]|nr:hypothetical protein SEA_FAITH5X5_58 [Gordonia phage Faith5x5]
MNAVILCALLTAAGALVWWLQHRMNARPEEHNQVTGRGWQA